MCKKSCLKVVALFGFLASILVMPVASNAGAQSEIQRYSMGTSTLGSNYYVVGTTIAQMLSRNMKNVEVTAEVTNGSGVNYGLVQKGEVQLALIINNAAFNAWNGEGYGVEKGQKQQDVRALAALMPSSLNIYTLSSSPINVIEDLNGKSISPGAAGSGGDLVLNDLIPTLGLKPANIQHMGMSDINSNIIDHMLDACALFAGYPSATVLEIEASADLKFVTMTADQRKKMVAAFPYYFEGTEPAGTYKNTPPQGYTTIMTPNLFIAHKDVSEEFVYETVKLIFEKMDELINGSSSFRYVIKDSVLSASIPLHPGAIRYFKEQGYTIPGKLIPPEYKK
jgi:TRAP transporter TAXI family solute receptor